MGRSLEQKEMEKAVRGKHGSQIEALSSFPEACLTLGNPFGAEERGRVPPPNTSALL